MKLSLVGSRMSREATSEQLSIREGAGYDEVFQSGREPEEGFSWSSERETSIQSSNEEVGSCRGEDEEVVSEDEGEEEKEEKVSMGMRATVVRRS